MVSLFAISEQRTLRQMTTDELRTLVRNEAEEPIIWVDMNAPTSEEEELILRDIFQFHPLAIQDCQRERLSPERGDHLPKVEDYGRYLFSIINPLLLERDRVGTAPEPVAWLKTRQLNVFLGENFIVTHHYEPSRAIEAAQTSCNKNPHFFERGPDYIYHLILDEIVDDYSPILDEFDRQIDALEDEVFAKKSSNTLTRILGMKRTIFRMRRITAYQQEMLFRLSRGEFHLINEREIAYYRNVYDHLVRAADLSESYRDVLTGMLEAHLSVTSNRMNEVVKVLTIISTFFLPLTFIAGVYGMNFEFMPELHWRYGYLFALGLMLGVALVMFIFFRRKGWM